MPVHFKGTSEYDNNYKWLDSFKSRSFSPEPEQIMDPAGKPSVKIYTSVEPPLQHKKRLDGPATSLSTGYFAAPGNRPEFTLLGNQEKFADNVKYQLRQSGSEQKIYKNKENFGDASPPSKQLKMQKRIKPLMKERHPPLRPAARQSKPDLISPPPAPREVKSDVELKAALKSKDLRDVLCDSSSTKVPAPAVSKSVEEPRQSHSGDAISQQPDMDPPTKARKAEAPRASMNEFVQTNMKKGVAMSAPEAPSDYALKYKAGMAQDRPLWKSSEYQKQFQWKKGVKASPLLAAEEIVHRSNAELGPYKTDGVPRLTEYNRQFQAWKPQVFASDMNLNNNNSNNNSKEDDRRVSDKVKIKRSKSAAAPVVRRSAPAARVEDDDDQGDKEKVAEELKLKLAQTHGKIRRQGTEYRSNYKSPTRFSYGHGAWKGASAPQMMPRASDDDTKMDQNNNNNNNNNNATEAEEAPPLSNWFAEVIELRRRAAEYRKRAQGTHFSREHVLQLLAQGNRCWDLASANGSSNREDGVASDNLQALDLHTRPPAGKPSPLLKRDPPADGCSHEATEGDSPDMSDVEEDQREDAPWRTRAAGTSKKAARGERDGGKKKGKAKGAGRKSRKMAWLQQDREAVAEQARTLEREGQKQQADYNGDDAGNDNDADVEGRLPTPVLKKESPERSRRHHLDLTTPSVGGAILTCSAPKGSKLIVTSRSGDSYVTASDDFPPQQQPKTYNMDHLLTMPTLGRPSGDTHLLRDDDAESDRPLQTRYVVTPVVQSSDEDKENAGAKQQQKRGKASKPSKLSAVQEGFGRTWAQPGLEEVRNKRLSQQPDDDALSVSMMSVASSASLASEVLERARKRQEFWNKDNKAC